MVRLTGKKGFGLKESVSRAQPVRLNYPSHAVVGAIGLGRKVGPTTVTIEVICVFDMAHSIQASIDMPATGWRALGARLLIRVPLPAANITPAHVAIYLQIKQALPLPRRLREHEKGLLVQERSYRCCRPTTGRVVKLNHLSLRLNHKKALMAVKVEKAQH